ncbi:MAG: RluA family pseudouridine synthase, partial [Rhodopirellula sp. JB053]
HIGCPILCDRLYAGHAVLTRAGLAKAAGGTGSGAQGDRNCQPDSDPNEVILDRQALHAYQLTLVNPQTQQEMTFTAPLPDDMGRVINLLT